MDSEKQIQLYLAMLSIAQNNPSHWQLWENLSKIAPTTSAKTTFTKYAQFLKNKTVMRNYRFCDIDRRNSEKVTFVVLTQAIMSRVNKVAHVAQIAGIQLQLVLCFHPDKSFVVDHDIYNDVIIVGDMFCHLNDVFKSIRNFESVLIHMFVDCVTNLKAALWAIRSPLPIIGDQYDLCCSQYVSWTHNMMALKQNVFYENAWLQHIDGICTRTHYMKTEELRAVYRPGTPVFYMPEPVRTKFCVEKDEAISTDGVNILMDGLGADVPCYGAAYEEVFSQAKQAGNICFHLYRYQGRDLSEYGDTVRTYPRLPENVFIKLMRKCDAFMLPWCLVYLKDSGYSYALSKYGTRSTASDIMEADIINIVPNYFSLIAKNATKCNRGLAFTQADQRNPDFWKNLPQRIAQLRKQPVRRERFMDTSMAPHLKSFYQKVVAKVAQKRRLLMDDE